MLEPFAPVNKTSHFQGIARDGVVRKNTASVPSAELVTPPTGVEPVTYYTTAGVFYVYSSGWADYTSKMPSIQVVVDGSDIYIAGLAYWAKSAWIKGTISGKTATFPAVQQVDDDPDYPEWISGSDDGETITDVVFEFDQEAGTLVSQTKYIGECASTTKFSLYAYWEKPSFSTTEPVAPEVVVLPDGVEASEYHMSYKESETATETTSKPVNVAVDGNDVYFQGMSQNLPQAWVKGTKSGNTVTFPAKQYMGDYGSSGSSYFFYGDDAVVFTYDATTDTYSAEGHVFGVRGGQYYDGNYFDPVLKKITEVAATPATPTITGIEGTSFGDVVTFQVPIVDVNDNGMVVSKLSYQFFVDDESTPLEFTTEYFTKLTENMTVIPYGFTDKYDFYSDYIYLNMPHSTWKKLGIQSIYTGGGVTNKSEIFWFTMPEPPVEAPDGLTTETYIFSANAIENGKEEEGAKPYTIQVKVGFASNDVFIQGIAADAPELWVKGTKNAAGKYVIPANQYMGDLSLFGYTFPYYLTALNSENEFVDVVLDLNTETNTFSTSQTVALNGATDELDYYLLFNDLTITKFIEVAATPVNPVYEDHDFTQDQGYNKIYANIPTVDGDGNPLNLDKLFYSIWYEKNGVQQVYVFTAELYPTDFAEDTKEIPYSYDGYDIYKGGEIIYLEDDPAELATWTKVGIQSIYYGAGERHASEIVWSDGTTGIKPVKVAESKNAPLYNLKGQRVNSDYKGLVIKNGKKYVVK